MNYTNKFDINGYYMGYPTCCIKSFRGKRSERTDEQHAATFIIQASRFRGYIPCHQCSEKVLCSEYTKLTDIFDMERRNLPLPENIRQGLRVSVKTIENTIFPELTDELMDKITMKVVKKKEQIKELLEKQRINRQIRKEKSKQKPIHVFN